jgi:hypothetical protein
MAEWEGFEPSRRVTPAYTISSRAPSANSDTTPRRVFGFEQGAIIAYDQLGCPPATIAQAVGRRAAYVDVVEESVVGADISTAASSSNGASAAMNRSRRETAAPGA